MQANAAQAYQQFKPNRPGNATRSRQKTSRPPEWYPNGTYADRLETAKERRRLESRLRVDWKVLTTIDDRHANAANAANATNATQRMLYNGRRSPFLMVSPCSLDLFGSGWQWLPGSAIRQFGSSTAGCFIATERERGCWCVPVVCAGVQWSTVREQAKQVPRAAGGYIALCSDAASTQ